MSLSFSLTTLASYLAGEFDNREQAIADPVWYVHLRLWLRPVPKLWEDSVTLFAEQANIVNLKEPYRPRLLRLRDNSGILQVEHYMFKEIKAFQGAGLQPEKLEQLTPEQVEFLPGCTLKVKMTKSQEEPSFQGGVSRPQTSKSDYHFQAIPQPGDRCCFQYQGATYQVALGFEVNAHQLQTYDKGIDPVTGKAIWGALLGPYRFHKLQQFT